MTRDGKPVWAYGVTTMPERLDTTLPRTMMSLERGGFPNPHLFIDGKHDFTYLSRWPDSRETFRQDNIGAYGNWYLGLLELYIREPLAEFYTMFQDDIICVRNLRPYLEESLKEFGHDTADRYWNLMTFYENYKFGRKHGLRCGTPQWFLSNQCGRSATGLVFKREALLECLRHRHMIERPMSVKNRKGKQGIDGGVVQTFRKMGGKEYVHMPSLVEHIGGKASTLNHRNYPPTRTFPGEDFDALEFLCSETE